MKISETLCVMTSEEFRNWLERNHKSKFKKFERLFAVMVSCLQEVDAIVTHEVNHAMLLG